MKLKLKHLAGYLPYKLIGKQERNNTFFYLDTYSNMLGKGIENRTIETWLNSNIKPILRPISDLTKEIEVNGEKFAPIDRILKERECDVEYDFIEALENDWASAEDKIQFAPYSIIQKLFEWQFDIYGLIENNLAIDINTL